ncbi:AAA domain-containing protein [Salinivibrio kushneri]|uniref:PLD phosphodiesterase domain-containing protein n=1 Tax=Salinivibrio kushneri TaxID=1908198 RepID=A0AB36K475_9GAMM|nr:AAA domain-containing protein [Salinivibrio kushneri]OOE42549.1 hypothetical protein BZG09_13335 [Salinivibrio kushneri]
MEWMKWAAYWRNCLADADSTKGFFNRKELAQKRNISSSSLVEGCLSSEENDGELFSNEPADTIAVKAHIWTFAFVKRNIIEHGKQKNSALPYYIAPIICPVWITRSGRLYPASAPFVSRDTLAPQHQDVITVSTVEQVDHFLSNASIQCLTESDVEELERDNPEQHAIVWDQAYNTARDLYASVCKAYLDERGFRDLYEVSPDGAYLEKIETSGSAFHIINAYDLIRENKPTLPLLNTYATYTCNNRRPSEDYTTSISTRIAHSGEAFPLADAQRDALTSTLGIEPANMLAINGPPGTGKTTFVLSTVASLWAKAALEDGEPPIIVAASTNNQAVTNIIEAFGKDFGEGDGPMAGRWLPSIVSYGGYLPAKSKQQEADQFYQTDAFYNGLENKDTLYSATHYLIDRARQAFPSLALSDEPKEALKEIKQQLHGKLQTAMNQLQNVQQGWLDYDKQRLMYHQQLGSDPAAVIAAHETELAELQAASQTLKGSLNQWRFFVSQESLIESTLAFLPAVKRKRQASHAHFVDTQLCDTAQALYREYGIDRFEAALNQAFAKQEKQREAKKQQLDALYDCQQLYLAYQQKWMDICNTLFDTYSAPPPSGKDQIIDIDTMDKWLDTHVRFFVFRVTVHYWEVRWLLACYALGKNLDSQAKKSGEKASLARWRRRMMLTPCIVSTFHALPSHMTIKRHSAGEFITDFLFNSIDWLIVDEAGQVSPEVAGASMAFAKRALVIGDTQQIQPVRSLSSVVDQGNLFSAGLHALADDYEETEDIARLVTQGSVMHVAQQASHIHYHSDAEPGMLLREHRRCYDDIIEYCNRLCYNGLLLPKRGPAEHSEETNSERFPALGYAHVDGAAVREAGSTSNRVEAIAIAHWLRDNREQIESQFGAPLEQAVGVVTPFRAQVNAIKEACNDNGILCEGDEKMTVGTVHSLQGAERKLVIFSHVYSRHLDGQFIDTDATMLNVAVSRAKDSFIVFADMQMLTHARMGSPRHVLGEMLLWRDNNALTVAPVERPDLLRVSDKPKTLWNAQEHDHFLITLLAHAESRVDIISPWLQARTLQETGLDNAMQQAVERGVKVTIYTDRHFNTTHNNRHDPQKRQRLDQCIERLQALDIEVYIVDGVHSKMVMADDSHMAVGSYNWLSAARQGRYCNLETSLYYSGQLQKECQYNLNMLVPDTTDNPMPA